jgi:peroxiredoxin
MKKLVVTVLAGCAALFAQQAQPPKTHLKVGDAAPDFTLPATPSGKPVKLSDLRGQKAVVLAFFPAAFTGGCTKEMLAYQAGLGNFEGIATQVYGISTDNVPSLNAFAEKLGVKFPLLSDFAKREVARSYGVLIAERGLANRATFVVDLEGKIAHIEEGSAAIDPTGAETACKRVHSTRKTQ